MNPWAIGAYLLLALIYFLPVIIFAWRKSRVAFPVATVPVDRW
jgi:hypothetical protein